MAPGSGVGRALVLQDGQSDSSTDGDCLSDEDYCGTDYDANELDAEEQIDALRQGCP